jgi:transposase
MDKQVAVNEAGYRIGEIAEKFGIGKSTVADICKGRRRCQCAFRWKRQSKRKVRVSKD